MEGKRESKKRVNVDEVPKEESINTKVATNLSSQVEKNKKYNKHEMIENKKTLTKNRNLKQKNSAKTYSKNGKNLKLFYTNADQFLNKRDELSNTINIKLLSS